MFQCRRPSPSKGAVSLAALLLALPASAAEWKFSAPLGVKNKKADFKLALTGYIQYDLRGFNWDLADPESQERAAGHGIRRVRTGLEMEWKRLTADFDLDYSGVLKDLVNDPDAPFDATQVKNAYLEYRFSKAFRLRGGIFKVPVSPEFLTSAGKTDFVERSLLALNIAPDRDWGGAILGEAGRFEYEVGVFGGDGRVQDTSARTTTAARVVASPIKHLAIGGSFSHGQVEAEPDGPGTDPSPKGFVGRGPTAFRWYDRKFVQGRRLRWGLDANYTRGPFALKGEFLQGREQRLEQGSRFDDLPEQVGNGWSVTGTWLVTGEKKERTIKPARTLPHGPGAIELALRYESLRYDDAGPNTGFEGAGNRARNIRPAQESVFWGGVSWWPARFVRLYGDLIVEKYLDPLLAPEPPSAKGLDHTPLGRGNYVTFVTRLQFFIP